MAAALEYRCFVGGLAWATDERGLADAFRSFGEVLESKVINDRETGRSRGFGFVTFDNEQSMLDAIESMNGKEIDGRNVTVNQAQSRSGGGSGAGGGGYRGNGGGYSASRQEDHRGYGNRSSGGSYGGRDRSDHGYGGSRGASSGYGGRPGGYGGNNRHGSGGGSGQGGADAENWRK